MFSRYRQAGGRTLLIATKIVLGASIFAMATQTCWAWGREGHRLTALVAEQYLTPAVRAQIAELLHQETLADVASWADDYRNDHPETKPWHFVDIPKGETTFNRDRDCPASASEPKSPWRDCVTDRILYFEGRLGDETLRPEERAEALKFVVHFIGDVHQPMHALGDDRGGNGIAVGFLGSSRCGTSACNLHEVWDVELIDHAGLSESKYLARLLEEIKQNQWERMSGGEPTTWANVSHHYAVEAYVPNGALITSDYAKEESKVVDAELALGGLRLARVLNRILAPLPVDTGTAQAPTPKPVSDAHGPAPLR